MILSNTMNGPSSMYRLQPPFKLPDNIEYPTCMYELESVNGAGDSNHQQPKNNEVLSSILDKKPMDGINTLEVRWDLVLQQLADLKNQMASIRTTMNALPGKSQISALPAVDPNTLEALNGAVVNADPNSPPYSFLLLQPLYLKNLSVTSYIHSTIPSLPDGLVSFKGLRNEQCDNPLKLLLVWKAGLEDTELVLNPMKQIPIRGEVNILRYLGRLGLKELNYPSNDLVADIQTDAILDSCHRLLHSRTSKEKTSLYRFLNAKLGRSSFFGGAKINICDIAVWSALKQIQVDTAQDLTQNMAKWFQRVNADLPN